MNYGFTRSFMFRAKNAPGLLVIYNDNNKNYWLIFWRKHSCFIIGNLIGKGDEVKKLWYGDIFIWWYFIVQYLYMTNILHTFSYSDRRAQINFPKPAIHPPYFLIWNDHTLNRHFFRDEFGLWRIGDPVNVRPQSASRYVLYFCLCCWTCCVTRPELGWTSRE